MKIIIRNRSFLLISQVLIASYLPIPFTTVDAATASLSEAPPPWAARQDAQVAEAAPQVAKTSDQPARSPVAAKNTAGHSIEQWYAQRQTYAPQAKPSTPQLQAKATQGDLNAQYALALQMRQEASPENIAESLKLQEKAARAGHVEAQYGLGVLYSNGQYVAQDQRLAHFWYTQAARRGSEAAKLALTSSAPQVHPVVAANHVQAANPVANANMLAASESESSAAVPTMSAEEYAAVEQVASTTTEATEPAEAQAPVPAPRPIRQHPVAQTQPEASEGVAPVIPAEGAAGAEGMPDLAPEEMAADPGDISVEHNESKVDLGNMSVQQVIDTAQKGDMYAQLMLGALFEDGTDPSIPKSIEEAAKWYAKAAKQGYPKAQHNLALLYEDGRGVPQSYAEAAKWYAKAAKAGFSEAQNNLAVLYIMGNGVKQDRAKAEKLLTAAVGQGNENARRNLQKLLEGTAS